MIMSMLHHIFHSTWNNVPVTICHILCLLRASDDIGSDINLSPYRQHNCIISESIIPNTFHIIEVPKLVLKFHFGVNYQVQVGTLENNLIREQFGSQVFCFSIIIPLLSKFLFFSFFFILNIAVPCFKIKIVHTGDLWCIFISSGYFKNQFLARFTLFMIMNVKTSS